MIYFTISLSFQQLLLLQTIEKGLLLPNRPSRDVDWGEGEKVMLSMSHFVSHVRTLEKNGLVEHHLGDHVSEKIRKAGGWKITPKGKCALELFRHDVEGAKALMGINGKSIEGKGKEKLPIASYVKA